MAMGEKHYEHCIMNVCSVEIFVECVDRWLLETMTFSNRFGSISRHFTFLERIENGTN